MLKTFGIAGVSLVALALVAGCEQKTEEAAAPAATPAPAAPAAPDYSAALLAGERPVADAGRDATRKPAEVLAFSKIMPGQTVLELEAGAGYYTELLSRVVGANGKVIMQAPKEFENFYKADLETRLANNRLANVTVSWSPFNKLEAADGSVDVVTWFQGPHELYCKQACGNAPMGDVASTYTEIFRVLKPGGYYVVMDHVAPTGAPDTTGNDLHRIDPMIVKAAATAAGFVLEEESKALANPSDDYTKGVFDDAVRGKTDQFLLRYQKPAG